MQANTIHATFLGTGSSHGVPVLRCPCDVCISTDPKDARLRSSIWLKYGSVSILIDTGPDLRQQLLRFSVDKIDAVLLTHEHNDHIVGLDDLRPYNYFQEEPLVLYGAKDVRVALHQRFYYIFGHNPYPGALKVAFQEINQDNILWLKGHPVIPVQVLHGRMKVLGFRMGKFAYVTDAKIISDEALSKLEKLDILILNALHFSPHPLHLNVQEALDIVERLQPKKTYLTHISHFMGKHEEINKLLPPSVELAYDGLELFL
jgi:phosphoribosyl 1,2-cyclic phosphate phosphodiesterase